MSSRNPKNKITGLSFREALFGRVSGYSAVFFVLSAAYLATEVYFNLNLLDISGTLKSHPEEVERITDFGRTVSAAGFTLLVLGLFAREKFSLKRGRERVLLGMLAAFSVAPFLMSVFVYDAPFNNELLLSFVPLVVTVAAFTANMRVPFMTVMIIIGLAWPAMFTGQKIFVENAVVAKTSWQTRADARNVLMLRSSLENCVVELGDMHLCEGDKPDPEIRAVRAIITALWMLSPMEVIRDLEPEKERIIEDIALRGGWYSPGRLYLKYLDRISRMRSRYQEQMVEQYYAPYKNASDVFLTSISPAKMKEEADKAWEASESEVDAGWKKYQNGVVKYNKNLSGIRGEMLGAVMHYGPIGSVVCGSIKCPSVKALGIYEKAEIKARETFSKESGGYTPDLKTRAAFIADPITDKAIRAALQKKMAEFTGLSGYKLPDAWSYSRKWNDALVMGAMRGIADARWKQGFGEKLPPGLSEDEFFAALGVEVPELNKLAMSQDEFIEKEIKPRNRQIIEDALVEMRAEEPFYDNHQSLEEKGRNYVRAAIVPAVALVMSLLIVLLTLFKGLWAGLQMAHIPHARLLRPVIFGLVLSGVILLPYRLENSYTSSDLYGKYRRIAAQEHPLVAGILDWGIRMQPVIYGLGNKVTDLGRL